MTFEAYVFVRTSNPGPRAACQEIRTLDGVVRADALFGGPAVDAIVRGDDLRSLDLVVNAIVVLPMVEDTDTHIVRPIDGRRWLEIALDSAIRGG
jgi:hypothetical protein